MYNKINGPISVFCLPLYSLRIDPKEANVLECKFNDRYHVKKEGNMATRASRLDFIRINHRGNESNRTQIHRFSLKRSKLLYCLW